jgi:hypothetical protein
MSQELDSELCEMLTKVKLDSPAWAHVWAKIQSFPDENVSLIRDLTVVQWLYGDLSFLGPIEKTNKTNDTKKYKVLEDKWGQDILRQRRPI